MPDHPAFLQVRLDPTPRLGHLVLAQHRHRQPATGSGRLRGTYGTSTTSTSPGRAKLYTAARVNARARATAPELVARTSKSRAVTARCCAKNSYGPRSSTDSSASISRPPAAGAGLSTRTPGSGSRRLVSVPAATLPVGPPPARYQSRICRPAGGTAATVTAVAAASAGELAGRRRGVAGRGPGRR